MVVQPKLGKSINVQHVKRSWTIGIFFHSPAKSIVLIRSQGQFSADFFLFAFRGETCEQKSKRYIK